MDRRSFIFGSIAIAGAGSVPLYSSTDVTRIADIPTQGATISLLDNGRVIAWADVSELSKLSGGKVKFPAVSFTSDKCAVITDVRVDLPNGAFFEKSVGTTHVTTGNTVEVRDVTIQPIAWLGG